MTKPKYDKWPFTEAERFEQFIDRAGDCHIWTGSTNNIGYGRFSHTGGKHIYAHRFAWMLAYGSIPDGLLIMHTCDNPPCVNPAHLFIGTHQDNMDDKKAKGRELYLKGEQQTQAKLTDDIVRKIRSLFDSGECTNQRELGRRFGLTYKHVFKIVRRQAWKHVK